MSENPLRVSPVAAPVRTQVTAKLREAVLNRTFHPGQRLMERELCAMTGVSRTSVREALRQLEAEGLVTMVPNRGPIVSQVTLREAADLYQVRGALEALAGQLFTERATAEQVAALGKAVDDIEAVVEGSTSAHLLELKDRFYAILFDGSANQLVTSILGGLHARVTYLRGTSLQRTGRSAETVKELRLIMKAVQERDADLASQAFLDHVHKASQAALEVLRREGSPDV